MKTQSSIWHFVIQVVGLVLVWICYVNAQSQCSCLSTSGGNGDCGRCHDGCFLSDRKCFRCPDHCYSCLSASYCDQCQTGFYGATCDDLCRSNCNTCTSEWTCTTCKTGYYGSYCQQSCSYCKNSTCYKDTGYCINGCLDEYYPSTDVCCPSTCSSCDSYLICTECKTGYYGSSCQFECSNCISNTCNKDTGQCAYGCTDGYYQPQGQHCYKCPDNCFRCKSYTECTSCKSKYYGPSCASKCDPNCKFGFCNSNTGECTNDCVQGYYQSGASCLPNCQIKSCQICTFDNQACSVCQDGYYLFNGNCPQCRSECLNGKCDKTDGTCSEGCIDGLTNRYCNATCYPNCIACEQYNKETCTSCKPGYHGQKCEYECNTQCRDVEGVRQCAKTNGECTEGCKNGFTGLTCLDECNLNCLSCDRYNHRSCDMCKPGFYGQTCDQDCSSHCGEVNNTRPCHEDTGECLVYCTKGYRGPKCDFPCEEGCKDGCDRETGMCDRCKTLYYGPSCEHTCNSTCYNPNNGSSVCEKQTGSCSFECSASQCGVQSGQENADKSNNNGTIIGAASGSTIVFLIVVILVIVFIVMRRKRQKTSNPEPDGMERGNTAVSVIPDKSTPVQVNSSTQAIYENGVYSDVEDRPSLPTIETADATEDVLEEINQDDIEKGTLADVEGPNVDNYYNIYGLTRSRIQLNKLNAYVSSKTTEDFEKEFKKLPEGLNRPYDDAVSPKNVTKNRYKGIYPYDATRVKLEGNVGDYINASFIEGFGELEKTYIASLGPIERFMKGYVDFWRMVWQENVDKIVMLTNFVEGTKEKCDKYWPDIGQTETYGHIVAECINVEKFVDFNISKLNVSAVSNSKTTTIHHFHFTAWPDRGTPSNVVSLVEFRESVERVQSTTKGPTVVHCSAGIGRTGTYIALDILTREGQTEGYADIFGCVLSLRGQRVGMVQNVDQYRYLHHAIEHSLTTKCEQIENGNFCRVSSDQIDERFHLLKDMKEYKDEEEIKAVEKNKKDEHRNRKRADIPGDVGRPKLSNHHKKTGSQYINAVYVDSFKQTNKYILAQTPLSATVEDFLGLVLQEDCSCIIALDDIEHTRKQVGIHVVFFRFLKYIIGKHVF